MANRRSTRFDITVHQAPSKKQDGVKESSKLKFHRNPLKTVSNAARTIRKSPKNQKKNSKSKGRVALMKVRIETLY